MKADKPHELLAQDLPWSNNPNRIWLASTFHLLRNIDQFKFPSKLETGQKEQLLQLIGNTLQQAPQLNHPLLFHTDTISPLDREFLVEHFLTQTSFQETSPGEGIILDQSGEILVTINRDNHAEFYLIDTRQELENGWNRLLDLEVFLGKDITYSFSHTFGFQTSNPYTCGTGLIVTLYLQPSALIHTEQVEDIIEKNRSNAFAITGLQGDPAQFIGDILAIHNTHTLGVSEEDILGAVQTLATKLQVEERALRNQLKREKLAPLMDKISRAYGVLIHSYQLEAIEAMNALSLLKLGIDLEWVTGLSIEDINRLFFQCRRAHLLLSEKGTPLPPEEIPVKRASFIHTALQGANLTL